MQCEDTLIYLMKSYYISTPPPHKYPPKKIIFLSNVL